MVDPTQQHAERVRAQRLFIIGASGSGKTTLANRLGRALDTTPVELDLDPLCDRAAIAGGDCWIVEGIFLFDISCLLERADVVVWLDLPRRVAQRRIVTRHLRLSLLRRNRYPGVRKLISFVQGMSTYYDKPAREPVAANDWEALSRALTIERLSPFMHKVWRVRTNRELRSVREQLLYGARVAPSTSTVWPPSLTSAGRQRPSSELKAQRRRRESPRSAAQPRPRP